MICTAIGSKLSQNLWFVDGYPHTKRFLGVRLGLTDRLQFAPAGDACGQGGLSLAGRAWLDLWDSNRSFIDPASPRSALLRMLLTSQCQKHPKTIYHSSSLIPNPRLTFTHHIFSLSHSAQSDLRIFSLRGWDALPQLGVARGVRLRRLRGIGQDLRSARSRWLRCRLLCRHWGYWLARDCDF